MINSNCYMNRTTHRQNLDVKIKKLSPNAIIPTYAKENDAGLDFTATSIDNNHQLYIEYGTGLSIEIPTGYVGFLCPRSSVTTKTLILKNSLGILDSSFRGEITFRFYNTEYNKNERLYDIGDRIGQMIILPYPHINFIESDTLTDTYRGTGGYGSTGK